MTTELKAEDFGDWDSHDVIVAAGQLFGTLQDILHHTYNSGDGWMPCADESNVPGLIAEARDHMGRLEKALKQAKSEIASVERPARLAAIRRQKREAQR